MNDAKPTCGINEAKPYQPTGGEPPVRSTGLIGGDADTCRWCWHWEPEMNPALAKDNTGYCPAFDKRTAATHGKQCTAHKPILPPIVQDDR